MLSNYMPNIESPEIPDTENPVSSTAAALAANWPHTKITNRVGGESGR